MLKTMNFLNGFSALVFYLCNTLHTTNIFMKKTFVVLTLSLFSIALVTTSCGNRKKKANCEAYGKAKIEAVEQESDLASK